jgi:signal transduction histidine kinase
VPVLLIVSVWAESILTGGLEAGADSLFFAPYQEADLLQSVRNALWRGASAEPAKAQPAVEIVHQDRVYNISAGRERLARLCFSLFEQLRQSLSALSWSQAEAEEVRKQLRQERQQAQIALMLPEAVQGIAHDLSNLLETALAAATVLRTNPPQPTPYRTAMDASLTQAGILIEALQNWTVLEKEENPAEAVDLSEVTEEVLKAALLPMRAPGIRLRVQVQGLPLVRSNRSLLFRSLSNLVWNAVQAMPTGGLLGVLGYVWKHRVVLEVSDTGVGIPQTDQERIFNPHFSTKNGHSGMGLFLVRTLVQRSGGEISFASHVGRGSTFALSFPMAECVQVVPPAARNRGARRPARERAGSLASRPVGAIPRR